MRLRSSACACGGPPSAGVPAPAPTPHALDRITATGALRQGAERAREASASARDRHLDAALDEPHGVVAESPDAGEPARLGLLAGRIDLRLLAGRRPRRVIPAGGVETTGR